LSAAGFSGYAVNLVQKAGVSYGSNEVLFLTGPDVEAVAQIGRTPQDRRAAMVQVSSLDGTRNVGLSIRVNDDSTEDAGTVVEHLVGSFRFTIDAWRARNRSHG